MQEKLAVLVLEYDNNNHVNVFSALNTRLTSKQVTALIKAAVQSSGMFKSKELNHELGILFSHANHQTIHYSKCDVKNKTIITFFDLSQFAAGFPVEESILNKLMFAVYTQLQNENNLVSPLKNRYTMKIAIDDIASDTRNANEDESNLAAYVESINMQKYPIKHKYNDVYVILSTQQSNILIALAQGADYQTIQQKYKITPKTTEHYLSIIKAKTGYRSKIELVCAFRATNLWLNDNVG